MKKPVYKIEYEATIKFEPSHDFTKSGKVIVTDTNGIKAVFSEGSMEEFCRWFLHHRYE